MHTNKEIRLMTGGGMRSSTGQLIAGSPVNFQTIVDPHERLYNAIGGTYKDIYLHALHKEYESDRAKQIWFAERFPKILNDIGESMANFKYTEPGNLLVPIGTATPTGNPDERSYSSHYKISHLSWRKNKKPYDFRFWRKKVIIPLCMIACLVVGGVWIVTSIQALSVLTSAASMTSSLVEFTGAAAQSSNAVTLAQLASISTTASTASLKVVGVLSAVIITELFVMIKAGKNYKKPFWSSVKRLLGTKMSQEQAAIYGDIIDKVTASDSLSKTTTLIDKLEAVLSSEEEVPDVGVLRGIVTKAKTSMDDPSDFVQALSKYGDEHPQKAGGELTNIIKEALYRQKSAVRDVKSFIGKVDSENMYSRFKPALHRHIKMKNAGWHIKLLYDDAETHLKQITLHYKYTHMKALKNSIGVLIGSKIKHDWVWQAEKR